MSTIRKQSILSSVIVYIGFSFGLFNTWLFTKEGSGFTQEQYGLTGLFIAISTLFFSFSQLGMVAYIYKFYPYYNDNLEKKENDMLTWSLFVSLAGYCLVIVAGLLFQDLILKKFGTNSPTLVIYYKWIFPLGLGLTLFSILEAYAWQLRKSVFTNFLREVAFRLLTTILIVLFFFGIIKDYDLFIKIYSFTYLIIALVLIFYLIRKSSFVINFKVSRVTKKFFKKILTLCAFVYGGSLVFAISAVFDTLVIASKLQDGLALAAIYTLAQNMASIIQAPQRGIISSSIGALSQAWKDKDMGRIGRIYHRSSINMLVFALALFSLIWLNFSDGVFTFKLQKNYIDAKWIFFYIGIMRIIDMGTGVNSQIIGTSTKWRFEFFTGIILLAITLPLNYLLTVQLGVIGPAIANLAAMIIYNFIRYYFLYKKYNLQPFDKKTVYAIIVAAITFFACYFLFANQQGFLWMIVRSMVYMIIFLPLIYALNISPDLKPVLETVRKRLKI